MTAISGSEDVSSEAAAINKSLLKMVTGHIANVRRQGTREINKKDAMEGGKVIILKNKFNGKTADEIWSTLILSLPINEINKMTPREENVVKKEEAKCDPETNDVEDATIKLVVTKPPIGRKIEKPMGKNITNNEESVEEVEIKVFENTKGTVTETKPVVAIEVTFELEQKEQDLNSCEATKEHDSLQADVTDIDKRKSVRDLKKAYDEYANESTVSLADHVEKESEPKSQSRRPKSNSNFDKWIPLTREGHAWILSATRGDYQTLARLARSDSQLVNCRDPATGYTALHWAAKHGHADIVKLLAGSYSQDPDVKTRGGYTPLMLAGMCKRDEVFDLLVKAYNADEDIRDHSGVKGRQYLEQHHMNIPGFPPPLDLSHDPVVRSKSMYGADGMRKSRTKVARSATHHFMKEIRESVRDVRGSIRANMKNRPKSIGE